MDQVLFLLPVGLDLVALDLQLVEVGQQGLQLALGVGAALFFQGLALDLQPGDAPLQFIQLLGLGIHLDAQLGGRFVDEVDGLVGQEALGDVAAGQGGGSDQRGVGDLDAVMDLVFFLQAAQDGDGLLHRRFLDQHGLEAPLQRRVLLDVFFVFVQRGGADGPQFAAGQGGLEHVGRVHRPLGGAGPDDGVQFVDEKDDLASGIGHFLDHGLQAVFEFAAVFGPGQQAADIQRDHFFVLEHLRDVTLDDAQRQPLGDGGLAYAGLADQNRVVLGAADQHLHDSADLLVAADDRVQLPLSCQLHQVAAVALQSLEFLFRAGIGDGLVAADLHQCF